MKVGQLVTTESIMPLLEYYTIINSTCATRCACMRACVHVRVPGESLMNCIKDIFQK